MYSSSNQVLIILLNQFHELELSTHQVSSSVEKKNEKDGKFHLEDGFIRTWFDQLYKSSIYFEFLQKDLWNR